jgi:DNA-binding NtrC family response regulator
MYEIQIPPLRERREDIVLLALHFIRAAAESLGKEPPDIMPDAKLALQSCTFPGNVRELQNRISNAVARNSSGVLTQEDFPDLKGRSSHGTGGVIRLSGSRSFTLHAAFETFPTIGEMEQLLVQEALKISDGSKSQAAELLGISRPTLNKKLALVESEGEG